MVAGGMTSPSTKSKTPGSLFKQAPKSTDDVDLQLNKAEANPDALDVIPIEKLGAADDVQIDEELAMKSLRPTYLESMRKSPFLIAASFIAALGGFLFGFDTGVINGVQVLPAFEAEMGINTPDAAANANLLSWIASSLVLAAAFAAPIAGPASDAIGRKWCIVASTVIVTIGGIVQAASIHWGMLIGGRIIVGLAIGLLSTVIPMYVSEIAPKSIRGSLGVLFQLAITIGILVAFLVSLAFNKVSGKTNDWRYELGIQAAISIALFFGMLVLPESPRWLIGQGREEQARKNLKRLRWVQVVGKRRIRQSGTMVHDVHTDTDTEASRDVSKLSSGSNEQWEDITNIDLEYLDVSEEVAFYDKFEDRSWLAYWKLLQPSVILRTSIGICLQFFQQLTGINAIFYYSSTIFLLIGADTDVGTAITGAVNVGATFIAVALMDKAGRRTLLLCGAAGMCASLAIVGGLVLGANPADKAVGNAIIAFICIFIVNFAYSWGPIGWIIPAEIFPVNVRAKGIAVATMSNWLANFAISKSVPNMVQPGSFGVGGTFIFFAAWALVMWLWVAGFIHETSGVTMEKMGQIYGVDTWPKFGRYVKHNFAFLFNFSGSSQEEYTDRKEGRTPSVAAQHADTEMEPMYNDSVTTPTNYNHHESGQTTPTHHHTGAQQTPSMYGRQDRELEV